MRGYAGKKTYEIDIKGNNVHELPGARRAIAGRIVLYHPSCKNMREQLLDRARKRYGGGKSPSGGPLELPWIKGGAIVAMDPNMEVLALASYPRIDPNDYPLQIARPARKKKQAHLVKWLENETLRQRFGMEYALWNASASLIVFTRKRCL